MEQRRRRRQGAAAVEAPRSHRRAAQSAQRVTATTNKGLGQVTHSLCERRTAALYTRVAMADEAEAPASAPSSDDESEVADDAKRVAAAKAHAAAEAAALSSAVERCDMMLDTRLRKLSMVKVGESIFRFERQRAKTITRVINAIVPAIDKAVKDMASKDGGLTRRAWQFFAKCSHLLHEAKALGEDACRARDDCRAREHRPPVERFDLSSLNAPYYSVDEFTSPFSGVAKEIRECQAWLEDPAVRACVRLARQQCKRTGWPVGGLKWAASHVLAFAKCERMLDGVLIEEIAEDEYGNALLPFPLLEQLALAFYGSPRDLCDPEALRAKSGAELATHAALLVDLKVHVERRLACLLGGVLRTARARVFAGLEEHEKGDVWAEAHAAELAFHETAAYLSVPKKLEKNPNQPREDATLFYGAYAFCHSGFRAAHDDKRERRKFEAASALWTASAAVDHSSDVSHVISFDDEASGDRVPFTFDEREEFFEGFVAAKYGALDDWVYITQRDYVKTKGWQQVYDFKAKFLLPIVMAAMPEAYLNEHKGTKKRILQKKNKDLERQRLALKRKEKEDRRRRATHPEKPSVVLEAGNFEVDAETALICRPRYWSSSEWASSKESEPDYVPKFVSNFDWGTQSVPKRSGPKRKPTAALAAGAPKKTKQGEGAAA